MGRKSQSNSSNKDNSHGSDKKRKSLSNKNNKVLIGQLVEKLLKEVAAAIPPEDPWNIYCRVHDILQEIKKLERKGAHEERKDRSPADIEEFLGWLKDYAVDCKGVKIEEFLGLGLGVRACKDYKVGDLVMRVPRKVMMSEERARMSPLGNLIDKDPLLKQMSHVTLALFLLLQKYTPDSFWKPYIKILPTSYSTILYFSPDDFQYLKGSPVYQPALMLFLAIARQYGYFYKLIHLTPHQASQTLKEHFTFDDYRWAVSTVMTRQNKVPGSVHREDDSEGEPPLITALIPLWDMCNHTQGEITTGFNRDADEAECFALKDFKQDEQILIFYGDRNNAYFFLYNGFVFEDNHHDSMNVTLGVSNSDPLCEDRKKVLARTKAAGASSVYTLYGAPQPYCISGELLSIARVLSMNKEQLTACLDTPNPEKLLEESPLPEMENVEKAAYSYINTRCKLLLHQYIKTLESAADNMKQLSLDKKTHRHMVDQLKKCEMKILQRAVEYTQLKIDSLTASK